MKHPVLQFERIDSTNLEARRLADQGERGPLWIVAEEQTSGRGRLGRTWVSQPGNLHATFLFSISAGPEVAAQVSFVAALAVHDMAVTLTSPSPLWGGPGWGSGTASVRAQTNTSGGGATPTPSPSPRGGGESEGRIEHLLKIKWPNDVLIGGAKFCGVLAEVVGQSPTRIAIGCGVNVAHAPAGMAYPVTCLAAHTFPPPLRGGGGSGPTREDAHSLRAGVTRGPPPLPLPARGREDAIDSVLHHLDASLSNRLSVWDEGRGFAGIRRAWEERALGIGGEVTANGVSGIFKGLAADGALIIELADGGRKHIHSGEVSFAELEILRRS